MDIKTCPSCGSRRIEKLRSDWEGEFEGQHYVVRDLEHYRCPVCGEQVFDREAMRKIEARSTAFARGRIQRTAWSQDPSSAPPCNLKDRG